MTLSNGSLVRIVAPENALICLLRAVSTRPDETSTDNLTVGAHATIESSAAIAAQAPHPDSHRTESRTTIP